MLVGESNLLWLFGFYVWVSLDIFLCDWLGVIDLSATWSFAHLMIVIPLFLDAGAFYSCHYNSSVRSIL